MSAMEIYRVRLNLMPMQPPPPSALMNAQGAFLEDVSAIRFFLKIANIAGTITKTSAIAASVIGGVVVEIIAIGRSTATRVLIRALCWRLSRLLVIGFNPWGAK